MMFGDEEKDDAAFDADLAALIEHAQDNGVPFVTLMKVVAAFYRRHGRDVPSPSDLDRLLEMKQ
jgi:hypothetical protein